MKNIIIILLFRELLETNVTVSSSSWVHIATLWQPGNNGLTIYKNGVEQNISSSISVNCSTLISDGSTVELGSKNLEGKYYNICNLHLLSICYFFLTIMPSIGKENDIQWKGMPSSTIIFGPGTHDYRCKASWLDPDLLENEINIIYI